LGKPPHENFYLSDPTDTARQDVDDKGEETNLGVRMPAPKGSAANPDGLVYSVGELGFIHTGIQPDASVPALKAVRHRTLRLQPEGDPKKVPDWALLDLFRAPLKTGGNAQGVLRPSKDAIAGRVNINSRIVPFGMEESQRPAKTNELMRSNALKAALVNASKNENGDSLSLEDAGTIASNIYSQQLAAGAAAYRAAGVSGYSMPAEIAQIKGVADGGESSEFLIRSVIDQLSTRGNVFTIYSVGQVLKQTPRGSIVVTSEQRLKSSVERYVDGSQTKLRQVSLESLVP